MNLGNLLKKRSGEHLCHWHPQFSGEWHCCGCPATTNNPRKNTAKCQRDNTDSFATWLPPARASLSNPRPRRQHPRAGMAA